MCFSKVVHMTTSLIFYVFFFATGVALGTGLWNTLLSVYIENRHDFEPLEFLKILWNKSDAEPNNVSIASLQL